MTNSSSVDMAGIDLVVRSGSGPLGTQVLAGLVAMAEAAVERLRETARRSKQPPTAVLKGIKKGQRLTVGRDRMPLDQAQRFSVFRPRQIDLSAGDRIRITQNGKTTKGEHRLNNGDLFTVKKFTKSGDLVLDNGWTLPKDYGHLTYGQVVTSHQSQGRTVDRVFIGQSSASFGASSLEQFYVSASRGREQAQVFTDNKIELLDAVTRVDERLSATELVAGLDPATRHAIRERLAEQAEIQADITAATRTLEPKEPDYDR